jgi:8-oxo-dGTP pyrophosphatase MutT (NUDIX family)
MLMLGSRFLGRLGGCAVASSSSLRPLAARRMNSTHDDDDGSDFLAQELSAQQRDGGDALAPSAPDVSLTNRIASAASDDEVEINLVQLPRPPAKFELMHNTACFKWVTTAKHGRKIIGPMREWAEELQCRTGVHADMDALYPEKAAAGDYETADDVDTALYFFGAEKAVADSLPLLKAMLKLDPCHVRVGLYRKRGDGQPPEWLTLRRVNRDSRPADIPAISLKTPGKYTMLFENTAEAAARTLFEETGVDVDRAALVKTNVFSTPPVPYFWRPPVHYFVAEMPADAEVLGPQAATRNYLVDWDARVLRQSRDAVDRVWAQEADPKTGCAWLPSAAVDELQLPVKMQDKYMALRYTPAPESGLQEVLQL